MLRNYNLISQEHNKYIQEKQCNDDSLSKILYDNKKLLDENKELNQKAKKLENLVFGKIRK